jgi:hypothetical protein
MYSIIYFSLKRDKISPVLVDNRGIYLLIEVKRPPIILQKISYKSEEDTDETRLPGTPSIGHANGWLFKLDYPNFNLYTTLFKVLRRYNLTPRQFNERNIIDLINLKVPEKQRLKSVRLLSNHIWIQQNQSIVDDFRYYRWPSYPFETKFEIMKLISKHIITFHDLIVDEKAETILKQCSINTLSACTGMCKNLSSFLYKTLIILFKIKLSNKLLIGSQVFVTMMMKIGTNRMNKKNNNTKNQTRTKSQHPPNIFRQLIMSCLCLFNFIPVLEHLSMFRTLNRL